MGPGGGACASAARLTRLEPGASAHQPNQKTPNNMNHTIRKTSQHDARVACELSHPFAASDPSEVWRIRLQQESFVSMPEGIILESNHQKCRAVVVNARSGDIVVISNKAGHENMAPYHSTSRVDLRREIFDSLLHYPEEWLKSNPKGIESIFKRLENLLGICFGSAELTILLEQMTPKGRMALSQYISSHI